MTDAAKSRTIEHGMWHWALAAIIVFPFAVLSHEAGHWVLAQFFGFPDARLHYASSGYATYREFWHLVNEGDWAAAGAIHPRWQPAAVAGGGLFVSYITIAIAIFILERRGVSPLVGALGAVASLRFLGGVPLLLARATGVAKRPSSDETNLALVSGIPEWLLLVLGFGALWWMWTTLWRTTPRARRWPMMRGLGLGILLGGVLYTQVLGPALLP